MKKSILISLCLVVTFLAMPRTATATGYWETVKKNAVVVIDTALGNLTAKQEKAEIEANWAEYRAQKMAAGLVSVGQVAKSGFYPVAEYTLADLGTTEVLTYFFIDPATGESTTSAFEVSAVRYEALLEPPTLNKDELTEDLIRQNLTLLGTSTDTANDFAFNFTLQGFEPMILGFPLDAMGAKITGEGTAGFASNVIPEPTTICLLGFGGLALKRRRRA